MTAQRQKKRNRKRERERERGKKEKRESVKKKELEKGRGGKEEHKILSEDGRGKKSVDTTTPRIQLHSTSFVDHNGLANREKHIHTP